MGIVGTVFLLEAADDVCHFGWFCLADPRQGALVVIGCGEQQLVVFVQPLIDFLFGCIRVCALVFIQIFQPIGMQSEVAEGKAADGFRLIEQGAGRIFQHFGTLPLLWIFS